MIDWYSRYVIAWRLSNTLDGSFCLEMLAEAWRRGRPEVCHTDQGVQLTAAELEFLSHPIGPWECLT